MKRLAIAASLLTCVVAAFAQDGDYLNTQAEVFDCSPPKFMLVKEVNMIEKTFTGMMIVELRDPKPTVGGYFRTLNLSEIKVTNAKRTALGDSDFSQLKGKLVVFYDGKKPLSDAYLGLFREDTFVVSVQP